MDMKIVHLAWILKLIQIVTNICQQHIVCVFIKLFVVYY
jgi:hypothetical protein